MCPLANNWPPQYYAPPLCTDLWSKVDIPIFNVPNNNWLLNTILTAMLIFWSKVDSLLMCPLANWPPQYYAPHYYALIFGPRWIFKHFNVLLPTTGLLNTKNFMH
jgi:hypothetical protein